MLTRTQLAIAIDCLPTTFYAAINRGDVPKPSLGTGKQKYYCQANIDQMRKIPWLIAKYTLIKKLETND